MVLRLFGELRLRWTAAHFSVLCFWILSQIHCILLLVHTQHKCFLVCIFYFPCVLIQYRMGVVELLAVPDGDAVVVIQPGFPTGHAARFFKSYRIACDAYSLLDNHITNWLEVSAAREQR